jgi:hypothetical protein
MGGPASGQPPLRVFYVGGYTGLGNMRANGVRSLLLGDTGHRTAQTAPGSRQGGARCADQARGKPPKAAGRNGVYRATL